MHGVGAPNAAGLKLQHRHSFRPPQAIGTRQDGGVEGDRIRMALQALASETLKCWRALRLCHGKW